MPFVGKLGDEIVTPEEVEDDARPACLECGDDLRVRRTHERDGAFVARHFWHPDGGSGCGGGESDVHRRLKSIALSKLKGIFPCEDSGLEKKIGGNVADVYATFEDSFGKFGSGVAIEVQHKNEGKDIERTTVNYLREGYSVCWITSESLDGNDIDFSNPDWRYAGESHLANTEDEPAAQEDIEERPAGVNEGLICLDCPWDPSLSKANKRHVYEMGDIYRCEYCGGYFIEDEMGGGVRRVAHESNLEHHPTRDRL